MVSRTHDEASPVGKYPKYDSSQRDHATIMPQVGEGPATGCVLPGSNFCGAQPTKQIVAVDKSAATPLQGSREYVLMPRPKRERGPAGDRNSGHSQTALGCKDLASNRVQQRVRRESFAMS